MDASVSWITVAPDSPYFVTEHGTPWTPIGQNDAITWPDFAGLIERCNLSAIERHLRSLRDSGVTCLRLMLEYCEDERAYLERPAGCFRPAMVALWDDLVRLCAQVGLRLLLTPFDTFFTWNNWADHPYNRVNGGPCSDRTQLLTCPQTRELIKARLTFATRRWGASGVIFAWDLWNEMHPVQGKDLPRCFEDFIEDVGPFLRSLEHRVHGRAHLQTVSIFGPELRWKAWLNGPIYRHPALDFATIHLYEEGTIDFPEDTIAPAVSTGRLIREALSEIRDGRPLFDSEHGPIHTYKDHGMTLPEAFDDEYFRHMQWAHFASGAAGGGMRWPNRSPHTLTAGMRQAQRGLAGFLPLIDWRCFRRRNLNEEVTAAGPNTATFACGDADQAVVWLLRKGSARPNGQLDDLQAPVQIQVSIPELACGRYLVTFWNTLAGQVAGEVEVDHASSGPLRVPSPPFVTDLALAVRRC